MKNTSQINRLSPILASKSPRRQFLLTEAGIEFETILQDVEEIYPETIVNEDVPTYLAKLKILDLASIYPKRLIISADTIVICNDHIFGKPANAEEAIAMLHKLANHSHQVITGVCLALEGQFHTFSEKTNVHFGNLTKQDIEFYVHQYKPFDKAGSYGIQEWIGYVGIKKIDGCFYNVMGLPVYRTIEQINLFINK